LGTGCPPRKHRMPDHDVAPQSGAEINPVAPALPHPAMNHSVMGTAAFPNATNHRGRRMPRSSMRGCMRRSASPTSSSQSVCPKRSLRLDRASSNSGNRLPRWSGSAIPEIEGRPSAERPRVPCSHDPARCRRRPRHLGGIGLPFGVSVSGWGASGGFAWIGLIPPTSRRMSQ
jgi:hypothetical protein